MNRTFRAAILLAPLLVAVCLKAQETSPSPKVRVNVVNVCTPGELDSRELAAALARIPERPALAADFEIARGRTTDRGVVSEWVRLRRDFAGGAFSTLQFLLSTTGTDIEETLVFHFKTAKPGEPLQVAFESAVTQGTPADVLASDTPPNRIRLERFGKPSLILARCPSADQSAYEPLFRIAAERSSQYRAALNVRATVSAELARLKPDKAISEKKKN